MEGMSVNDWVSHEPTNEWEIMMKKVAEFHHKHDFAGKNGHDIVEGTLNAILELYPIFSRMKMLRQWGGIVDICPDASPIISKTSIKGLYFNCLLYTSPSPRDMRRSRMPSSA